MKHDLKFCEKCRRHQFTPHNCPPAWRVWNAEESDGGYTVYAHDAEDAALLWAQDTEENYTLIDHPETVAVSDERGIVFANLARIDLD